MATRRRLFRTGSVGLLLCALAAGSRAESVLDPWGPVGASERQLLYESLGVMMLVVVPVLALTIWFAWWFRASNKRATYLPDWSYSGKVEFTIWIIPLLIVLFLAALAWSARTSSIRIDRCAAAPTSGCGWRWSRWIGSGCSSTPSSAWPASTNLPCRS